MGGNHDIKKIKGQITRNNFAEQDIKKIAFLLEGFLTSLTIIVKHNIFCSIWFRIKTPTNDHLTTNLTNDTFG